MAVRRLVVVAGVSGLLLATPAMAAAQEASPDTTVVVETSTVEQQVPVATTETREVDDDDDDSDKTGLWGLLGLLGLAGLAGLKRRGPDESYRTSTAVGADTKPRGSTSPND